MSKHTINLGEPADRPINIDISLADLHALVMHHKKRIKAIPLKIAKELAKTPLLPSQLKAMQKLVMQKTTDHSKRAKHLNSILFSTLENKPS